MYEFGGKEQEGDVLLAFRSHRSLEFLGFVGLLFSYGFYDHLLGAES